MFAVFLRKSYILETFCSWDMGQKYSQPIRMQDFLINHISRTNQWNSLIFLHFDTNSHKFKVDQKILGCLVKNRCGQSGQGTLNLTVSLERTDKINWYFACGCKFRKTKLCQWFSSRHGQKWVWPFSSWEPKNCILRWVDELSWFFACYLWCNNFWLEQNLTLCLWLLNVSLLQLYLLDLGW